MVTETVAGRWTRVRSSICISVFRCIPCRAWHTVTHGIKRKTETIVRLSSERKYADSRRWERLHAQLQCESQGRHPLWVVCLFLRGRCRRRYALYWSGRLLSFLHVGSEREQVTSSFTESRPVSLILRFSSCRFAILEKLGLPKLEISPGEFDGLSPLQW